MVSYDSLAIYVWEYEAMWILFDRTDEVGNDGVIGFASLVADDGEASIGLESLCVCVEQSDDCE